MGRITVHVVPRATSTEIAGPYGDAVRIRVGAPPAAGAANAELLRFLADRLGVPRGRIRIVAGALGRRKVIEVQGLESGQLRDRLTASR